MLKLLLPSGEFSDLFYQVEGGDKVPISKFGLWTSAVVFIGPIKTYLVFDFFDSVEKKPNAGQI